MNPALRHRTIALAGLFQAARLVQQTATGADREEAATTASLKSIFNTDPESVGAVYGDCGNIVTGLEILATQLGGRRRDLELARHVLLLLRLERKLKSNAVLLEQIRTGIDATREQADISGVLHPAVIAALAGVYRNTISTLQPRIMVHGEPGVLADPQSKDMIRALLLAGMRAAVLWRQCGGSLPSLIFRRRSLLDCSRKLLAESTETAGSRDGGPGV
jgi:high frequency lysogenization protein